jgi:hypothetical protein
MSRDAPQTPAELLAAYGEELYGAHWMNPLSRDLGISQQTISRWYRGKSIFREGPVLDAIRVLVESHRIAVARARAIAHREEN